MKQHHINSKVFALSILLFPFYGCDNNPDITGAKVKLSSDSISYESKQIKPCDLTKPASASSIFMTFFHGMSIEQFEAERENLVSDGLLIKLDSVEAVEGKYEIEIDNLVFLFEPAEGAKFRLQPRYFTREDTLLLSAIELLDRNSSEMIQNKVLTLYKKKYGDKYNLTRNVDKISIIHGQFAGKVISNKYTWQQNDGKYITLTLFNMSKDYKPRIDRPSAIVDLLIDNSFKSNDWVRISSIKTFETHVEYIPKEAFEYEKNEKAIKKRLKDEIESSKLNRFQKNATNI